MLSYALVHPTTKEFDSMLFTSLCSMLLATSMFGATQSSDLLLKKQSLIKEVLHREIST